MKTPLSVDRIAPGFYLAAILAIATALLFTIIFSKTESQQFIYFQF